MLHHLIRFATLVALVPAVALCAAAESPPLTVAATPESNDLVITSARIRHLEELDLLVFEQQVRGSAGATTPEAAGQLDGAPVLGYVFPTTLAATDIGFAPTEGIVALAVTAHPDFDDTPLWDENNDRRYDNDGVLFHSHWVILRPDERVAGGLAVGQIPESAVATSLPPTNPGMPLLLDSPGFSIVLDGDTLRVLVPAQRVSHRTDFSFDAVSAYMEVSTVADRPMLGVYHVYSVLSGELTLPFSVTSE